MFTDDDLKRLKELVPKSNPLPNEVNHLWYKLGPLLARLEAAERLIEIVKQMPEDGWDGRYWDESLVAWLTAKGAGK